MTTYTNPNPMTEEEQLLHMSEAYRNLWNADVQERIRRDIESYRKADASCCVSAIPEGTEVSVEQISHQFIFGAHIFNFDQLGTDERNRKYRELYGTLFNSATIAFYWSAFEPEEDHCRFSGEYRDSAEFWNRCPNPKEQPHWRRPATDPVVEFCESKGIRLHGHTLTWGNHTWQYPRWQLAKLPKEYLVQMMTDVRCGTNFMSRSAEEMAKLIPEYTEELNRLMELRIRRIAGHYRGRIHSWDVVNESASDFAGKRLVPGSRLCKSVYGLMPGDYPFRSMQIADDAFPENVKLNINDYFLTDEYVEETADLIRRGCRIDIMGAQMHLFNPQICLDIAEGKSEVQSPASVRETMERLSKANLPIHLSEITITSPGNDARGQIIQAVIARNLYRLWFSIPKMMGITWWNVVDDCGAPGEPSVSGLFTRDMQPKSSYFALNDLINREWKTRTSVTAGKDGQIEFRGFRGTYRLQWLSANGEKEETFMTLN